MATKKRATAKKTSKGRSAKATTRSTRTSKSASSKSLKNKARASGPKKKAVGKKKAARKKSPGGKAAARKATSRRPPAPSRREPPAKRRLSTFADAVKIYEAAVRLVHQEQYAEARGEFDRLVGEYPNETELLDRANVLIQVCDKRIQEKAAGSGLKSGNDYYNLGVAEMNGGALDDALEHLEQALKLLPTADHVLYALAAVSSLRSQREQALEYLAQSIEQRTENRFLAANDGDFAFLSEDPDFIQLVSSDTV
jgi:tetratricopeptide (TPR) repeat protein